MIARLLIVCGLMTALALASCQTAPDWCADNRRAAKQLQRAPQDVADLAAYTTYRTRCER